MMTQNLHIASTVDVNVAALIPEVEFSVIEEILSETIGCQCRLDIQKTISGVAKWQIKKSTG